MKPAVVLLAGRSPFAEFTLFGLNLSGLLLSLRLPIALEKDAPAQHKVPRKPSARSNTLKH
jgi:hypothetical protein